MKKAVNLIFILFLVNSLLAQKDLFRNPRGNFFSFGTEKNRTSSITSGDIDNDGDIDVIVANGRHWAEQNEIYLNSGTHHFTVSDLFAACPEAIKHFVLRRD